MGYFLLLAICTCGTSVHLNGVRVVSTEASSRMRQPISAAGGDQGNTATADAAGDGGGNWKQFFLGTLLGKPVEHSSYYVVKGNDPLQPTLNFDDIKCKYITSSD